MGLLISQMGDASVEVTEENRDTSQTAKGKAMEAISEGIMSYEQYIASMNWGHERGFWWIFCDTGNLEEAIEHLTEAILLNPTSAIMYGTRGLSSLDLLFSLLFICLY